MANFNELREKVFTVVRDSGRTFITEADVDQWLSEAMLDLSSRLRLAHGSASGTVTSGSITLPTDYIDLISLAVDGVTDGYIDFDVDTETFDQYQDDEDDPGVTIGRVFNGAIELYPAPSNGTAYTLRYWATESAALADFSGSLQIRMVNYARAHALYKNREDTTADRYMALYEQGLPGPNTASRNHDPGPLTIKPALGYFDSYTYLGY